MTPPALPTSVVRPPRTALLTALAWLAIAGGAVTIPISVLSALMLSVHHYGNQSDPIGFLIVVCGPSTLLVAGVGLLLRKSWGYFLALALLSFYLLSCVVDIIRAPFAPATTFNPSAGGVPTTTFHSGSRNSIPPLLIGLGLLTFLFLPPVRAEFRSRRGP